jgi:hydroxypyruvate isomerase
MNRRAFGQLALGAAISQLLPQAEAQGTISLKEPRFSVMLWTIEKQASFERCIEIVRDAGYQGIELVGEFQKWSVEETQQITAKMRAAGLVFDTLSGVKAGFADPDGADELMTQLTTQFRYAKELGSPQVILKSGPRIPGKSAQDQHSASVENLKRVADFAAKNDIEIVIEPIDPIENPTIFMTSVTEGFEIVRAVGNPHVKLLYDFYHEQRAYGT